MNFDANSHCSFSAGLSQLLFWDHFTEYRSTLSKPPCKEQSDRAVTQWLTIKKRLHTAADKKVNNAKN
jgi:hypothetical protein